MNDNFNEWYHDVGIALQDGQLEKRTAAIENYTESITVEQVMILVKLYYGMPVSDEEKRSFASAFSNEDPGFSVRYTIELALLAGAVLVELAENSDYSSLVELLTLSVSFHRKPVSSIEMQSVIQDCFDQDRIELREDFDMLSCTVPSSKEIAALEKSIMGKTITADAVVLELVKIIKTLQTSLADTSKKFNELLEQQSIYKEDSQLLWWMMAEWSETYRSPLRSLETSAACLALGWEAAGHVANYPGPYAMEGIIQKQLGACHGADSSIDLVALVKATDSGMKREIIHACASIGPLMDLLPVCSAISRANNTESADEWYPKYKKELMGPDSNATRMLHEYAWQMYLEHLIVCYMNGITVK